MFDDEPGESGSRDDGREDITGDDRGGEGGRDHLGMKARKRARLKFERDSLVRAPINRIKLQVKPSALYVV